MLSASHYTAHEGNFGHRYKSELWRIIHRHRRGFDCAQYDRTPVHQQQPFALVLVFESRRLYLAQITCARSRPVGVKRASEASRSSKN